MTIQISDKVLYDDSKYDLIACTGGKNIFDPSAHGITPAMINTACWRGYISTYNIKDNVLYLEKLVIQSANENYPEINGKTPVLKPSDTNNTNKPAEKYSGPYQYDLDMPVSFTGKVILGEQAQDILFQSGHHQVYDYEKVLLIQLENGVVTDIQDLSKKIKTIRLGIIEKTAFSNMLKENRFRYTSSL